jgi:ABC-2 type transport system permease protein
VNVILRIARRELAAYLKTMSGYVIIAAQLMLSGLLFQAEAVSGSRPSAEVVSRFFYLMSGTTMAASIFISMRLLAEERQVGTLPLLYSSPIRDVEIVVGKFLSGLVFLALMVACSFYMPMLVMVNGKVSGGHLVSGYLGLLMLGSASLAIGVFGSSLAKNQVLAAIISALILATMIVIWMLSSITERPFSEIFGSLALHGKHFMPFGQGIVHTRDIVYYLVVTYVMLFGATRVLEARRWR